MKREDLIKLIISALERMPMERLRLVWEFIRGLCSIT